MTFELFWIAENLPFRSYLALILCASSCQERKKEIGLHVDIGVV